MLHDVLVLAADVASRGIAFHLLCCMLARGGRILAAVPYYTNRSFRIDGDRLPPFHVNASFSDQQVWQLHGPWLR